MHVENKVGLMGEGGGAPLPFLSAAAPPPPPLSFRLCMFDISLQIYR